MAMTGLAAPLSPSATSSTPVVRRSSGRAPSGSCCELLTVGRSIGRNRCSTVHSASTDSDPSLRVPMPGVRAVAGSTTGMSAAMLLCVRKARPPSSDHLQSRHPGEGHVHPRLPAGAVVAALLPGRHAAPVGVHHRGVQSLTATSPRLRSTGLGCRRSPVDVLVAVEQVGGVVAALDRRQPLPRSTPGRPRGRAPGPRRRRS
jgi:hypothetical protein